MKKSEFGFLGAMALSALATPVFGNSFVDIQNPNAYVPTFGSYSGTFDLVNPGSSTFTISGFPSGNGTFSDAGGYALNTPLTSVSASFYVVDSFLHIDVIDVSLGNFTGVDDALWLLGKKATFSFAGQNGEISWLEQNGTIGYQISSDFGDFTLQYAMLTANTSTGDPLGGPSVPDGGTTLVLLGMSLLAVLGVRKGLVAQH